MSVRGGTTVVRLDRIGYMSDGQRIQCGALYLDAEKNEVFLIFNATPERPASYANTFRGDLYLSGDIVDADGEVHGYAYTEQQHDAATGRYYNTHGLCGTANPPLNVKLYVRAQ